MTHPPAWKEANKSIQVTLAIKYRRSCCEGKIAVYICWLVLTFFFFFFRVLFCLLALVVQDSKECVQNKDEQNRLVIKNLKEENEKLSTHCADLVNDLEKLRKQEAHWRKEKCSIDAKIKVCNENGIYAVIFDLTSYRKFYFL